MQLSARNKSTETAAVTDDPSKAFTRHRTAAAIDDRCPDYASSAEGVT